MSVVENLNVYLADFGVPVTFSGAPSGTVGILDFHDMHALAKDGRAEVIGRVVLVHLKSSVAALLAVNQAITVNSVNYIVRDPEAQKDGAFTVVALRKAT